MEGDIEMVTEVFKETRSSAIEIEKASDNLAKLSAL